MNITIYSDYTCPFCFIGTGIIAALKREFPIEDDWQPYEVHPDLPVEGVLLADYAPDMNPKEFFGRLDAWGKPMDLRFGTPTMICNSRAALELGELARAEGLHQAFHEAAYRAYFTDCRDIGKRDVLLDVAAKAGLSREAAQRALDDKTYTQRVIDSTREGKERGVRAAPTFFLEGWGSITGAQPLDTYRKALRSLEQGGKGPRPLV